MIWIYKEFTFLVELSLKSDGLAYTFISFAVMLSFKHFFQEITVCEISIKII